MVLLVLVLLVQMDVLHVIPRVNVKLVSQVTTMK